MGRTVTMKVPDVTEKESNVTASNGASTEDSEWVDSELCPKFDASLLLINLGNQGCFVSQ